MGNIKKIHIVLKTVWQIFLIFLEIGTLVGILTWFSCLLWKAESGLDILERIGLFYGFYQLLTYIILTTKNDIKADEYIALKNNAALALKACEYNDSLLKEIVAKEIDTQLTNTVFNDLVVRDNYVVLKECINQNALQNIEYIIIWAEHGAQESMLQWKFSFLLRLVK